MAAKELAEKIGVSLPTILGHLQDLSEVGLVIVDHVKLNGKVVKKYRVVSRKIVLNIDIKRIREVTREEEEKQVRSRIEELTLKYICLKRKRGKLPLTVKVRDVMRTLGVDLDTAIMIVEFFNTNHSLIVDYLSNEILNYVEEKGEATIREISDKLHLHPYWVVFATQNLSSKGLLVRTDNKVYSTRKYYARKSEDTWTKQK